MAGDGGRESRPRGVTGREAIAAQRVAPRKSTRSGRIGPARTGEVSDAVAGADATGSAATMPARPILGSPLPPLGGHGATSALSALSEARLLAALPEDGFAATSTDPDGSRLAAELERLNKSEVAAALVRLDDLSDPLGRRFAWLVPSTRHRLRGALHRRREHAANRHQETRQGAAAPPPRSPVPAPPDPAVHDHAGWLRELAGGAGAPRSDEARAPVSVTSTPSPSERTSRTASATRSSRRPSST